MNYEKEILMALVSSYRKSKKNTGNAKTLLPTRIKPSKLYRIYYLPTSSLDEVEKLDDSVKRLADLGFVKYDIESNTSAIRYITLLDDRLSDIEDYLESKYGIMPATKEIEVFKSLIDEYSGSCHLCKYECDKLFATLSQGKVPTVSLEKEQNILKGLKFIDCNKDKLFLKEASMHIYGTSHSLDPGNSDFGYVLESICKVIREADDKPIQYFEQLDDILKDYGILKEPESIRVKGPVALYIKGKRLDIPQFYNGIEFSAGETIEKIEILCNTFMTIENKTAYNRMCANDMVCFYLGGFGNRFQKEFIRTAYKDNKQAMYFHFGDIDINGFWIHHDLCKSTDVPFELFHMGIPELSNPLYKDCLQPLTDTDNERLSQIGALEEYAETIKYMAANNIKLEQEIICLHLNGG